MFMKRFLLLLIGSLTLLLTGCSFAGGEMSALLTPPALSVGREALNKAIKNTIGEEYELVYPLAGSYRTGIISVDLNSDGETEGVCFYRPTRSDGKLSFLVMQNQSGNWTLLCKVESEAASVGRVAFGDLDANGISEIVVGWQYLSDAEGSYNVYSMENGEAVSYQTGLYTRFIMMEGEPARLLVMSRNSATKAVTASLIGAENGVIGLVNTVAMYGRAVDYLALTSAVTSENDQAVYVDEQLENGQYFTEVLAIDEQGRLTNELLNQPEASSLRYTAISCQDIDHDGVPEIPVEEALPSYLRSGVEEHLYLICWNSFDGKTLTPVSHSFVDVTEGFSVDYPDDWYGKVTVERAEDENRSFVFKTVEGEALFTIRVCSLTEYTESQAEAGWSKLYSDSDHVYIIYCEENSMGINYARVYGLFDVIN